MIVKTAETASKGDIIISDISGNYAEENLYICVSVIRSLFDKKTDKCDVEFLFPEKFRDNAKLRDYLSGAERKILGSWLQLSTKNKTKTGDKKYSKTGKVHREEIDLLLDGKDHFVTIQKGKKWMKGFNMTREIYDWIRNRRNFKRTNELFLAKPNNKDYDKRFPALPDNTCLEVTYQRDAGSLEDIQ